MKHESIRIIMFDMSKAATTIEQARINCSPKPLEGQGLKDFWIDTEDARDTETSFRTNLKELLNEDSPHKILVYGHRGCGKSTEINKLIDGLKEHWLPIKLYLSDYLPVSGNEAADVLLAASIRIMEVAKDRELSLNEKTLEAVLGFFKQTTITQADSRESSLKAEAGADLADGFFGKLLGLKASLVAALKFGSRTENSTIHKVRQRKGELTDAVNGLALAAEQAWIKKCGSPNGRLLLIVEELDKYGLADARQIFIRDGRILGEIALRTIYTIPVFTFHSPDAGAIRSYFDHDLPLPMIKTCMPDGKPCAEGRKVLRKIVRARVEASILPDDALETLIERTGGVLRDVFDAIQLASTFKEVRESRVITKRTIESALSRMVPTLGLQIAYPPEERKDPKPLQEKLAKIAKEQALGKSVIAQPDPDIQLLLMSGALIEYNGERWLGVHPLAIDYLKNLGYDVGNR